MKTFITLKAILFVFLAVESATAADKPLTRVNPFDLPRGVYSKDNIPEEVPQTLKLQAIFTIKGKKIATISGQNFMVGDFVAGKRLTNIFKNRVILDNAGKEESLVLQGMKFSIRKHMHN